MKSNSLSEEISRLDALRGKFLGRQGGWVMGDSAYSHGHDIIRELLPQKSYFHLLVLNATGEMPEDRFCQWLEAIYIGMSWPDPRIWCNALGSLGAATRASPITSTMAGLVAAESTLYAARTNISSINFIKDCLKDLHENIAITKIVEKRIRVGDKICHLPGYSRPIADGDIRVAAMLDYAESLGYEVGEHVQLGLDMSVYLEKNYTKSINFGGYICAFFADLGYTVEQTLYMTSTVAMSGIMACYAEDVKSPPNSFLPLRCDDIEYTGKAERVLPDAYKLVDT